MLKDKVHKYGADVNHVDKETGYAPLHYAGKIAEQTGEMNVLESLLEQAHKKGELPKEGYWVDEQQIKILKVGAMPSGFANPATKSTGRELISLK